MRTKIEKDGKILGYVIKPTYKEYAGAKIASSKAFREALEGGAVFRAKIHQVMLDQGLWDDKKEKELQELGKKIKDGLHKLKLGGIKKSEGKKIATEVQRLRLEQALLLSETREQDAFTIEGRAENASFDYLVSVCTVDEEENKIFKDFEDYKNRADEDIAFLAARELYTILYGDNTWQKELPENKFLLDHKFVDSELRPINAEGKFVNDKGELIDEKGRLINSSGELLDAEGNVIDENGNLLAAQPFLDD